MQRRHFLLAAAAAPALGQAALGAADAAYPARPVRIVVPVAPGGSADKLARTLALKLTRRWGQSVVVQNVPGAASAIGTGLVARAPADGYTLLLASDSLAVDAALKRPLPYDPLKDFAGIVKAVVNPMLLVVRPDTGVNDFRQYVALLKSRPGKVSVALPSGHASLQHLAHELIAERTGTQPNYIPYAGGGPATVDLLGGHVDAMIITLAAATEHVRAGRLVGLAVTTPYRSRALPEVPTLAESGLPGFSVESWQGLVAPAGTPAAIVDKLHRDLVAVLRAPALTAELEGLGFNVSAGEADDIGRTLRATIPQYSKVIAAAGIAIQ